MFVTELVPFTLTRVNCAVIGCTSWPSKCVEKGRSFHQSTLKKKSLHE